MNQTKIIIIILLLSAIAGYFIFASPTNTQPPTDTNKQETTMTQPTAVTAVKDYAVFQFSVPEDQVTIISSEKQTWDTICLGMKIEDYDCTEQNVSGYEVTVEVNDNAMKYRTSDDGKIIRFVKE